MERCVKVLMVCHGNICRSPMAEFVFNDMVRKLGLEGKYHADYEIVSTVIILPDSAGGLSLSADPL